jgi:hypothetical protein
MDPVGGLLFGVGLIPLGAVLHYLKSLIVGGTLGRNTAMGIRTRATTSSDRAWEAGHAAAVPMLTATYLTAYATAVITLATTLVLTLSGTESPAVVIIPSCGLLAVLAILCRATVRADSAARAAGDSRP